MSGRRDVEEKLAAVDDWVRREFLALSDAVTPIAGDVRDESGPGRSFRRNRRALVRLHPKQHHLAVGLPLALRGDVEALTGALRPQQGAAWFNYSPETGDRETLEALLDKSLELTSGSTWPDSEGRIERQPNRETDSADLALILAIVTAFHDHERATGTPSTVKVIREAIFFRWEAPRLPPGGKYSPSLPHSPAARQRRAAGQRTGLVYEHVVPVSLVVRELLANPPASTEALRRVLDAARERVIITKEEDRAIDAAGARSTLPSPDDPWSRYRVAGLDPDTFRPLVELL